MAMTYRHAINKLHREHSLNLFDPEHGNSDSSKDDRDLCTLRRDSRELWDEDPAAWQQVAHKFNNEVKESKSNWINKPRGDPTTLPQNNRKGYQDLDKIGLFQYLIDREKATLSSQPVLPFPSSQQDKRSTIAAQRERHELSQEQSCSNNSQSCFQSSSTDSNFRLPSSYIRGMQAIASEIDVGVTQLPENLKEVVDRNKVLTGHKILESEGSLGKRPASNHVVHQEVRKPRMDDLHPIVKDRESVPANFSFNSGADSLRNINGKRSISRSSSSNASYRSFETQPNESFRTVDTSSSFFANKSTEVNDSTEQLSDSDLRCKGYIKEFTLNPPFGPTNAQYSAGTSYQVIHEITRVALHNGYPVSGIFSYVSMHYGLQNAGQDASSLERLWAILTRYVNDKGGEMPEKTSNTTWMSLKMSRNELQYSKTSFTGCLFLKDSPQGLRLDFRLNPITMEQSNRMKRKFGSDRILVIGTPSLEARDMPKSLKYLAAEFRRYFIDWLVTTEHKILGRRWRAFNVKPKPRSRKEDQISIAWRVYMFATDGLGFSETVVDGETHKTLNLGSMLQWIFSFKQNEEQQSLKLFSRLQLAVSDTVPSLMFKLPRDGQIIVDDLSPDGSRIGRIFFRPDLKPDGVLMTDGCGRISLKAAEEICLRLRLPLPPPSAFQARIAGAKGIWIIEPSTSIHEGCELWIEIVESQNKFESLSRDTHAWDDHRIMFEVHEYSRPLRDASMNFQLLPILIDRGVKAEVCKTLLEQDLAMKMDDLRQAISTPQALRIWSQQQCPVGSMRLSGDGESNFGVKWLGGMPEQDAEQINAMTEAGLTPMTCGYLWKLCKKAIETYCTRVKEKMNIHPGKTTFAFMVPDFWGILEEDQIHLGFSSAFVDTQSGWSDTMLHGCDVLVARLPAALPSDIRRVRAVFKPELGFLKDVIVFPTKGRFCLADVLSGGDYDGDRAWICWNEAVVKDFTNFTVPEKKPYTYYGIEKIDSRIRDLNIHEDAQTRATEFIKSGFEFNMRKSALGRCTNLHEAYCYKIVKNAIVKGATGTFFSPICDPNAMDFANLLGFLVDTAKNGYTFNEDSCNKYLESIQAINLPEPAYKRKAGSHPTEHIIDQLVLVIAANFEKNALTELTRIKSTSINSSGRAKDTDLTRIYEEEAVAAKNDTTLRCILETLETDIDLMHTYWYKLSKQNTELKSCTWNDVRRLIRERFLSIVAKESAGSPFHPLARRWSHSQADGPLLLSTHSSWSLLKASLLYSKYPLDKFPWLACGKELLALKVLANGGGVPLSENMHVYMKCDKRMWKTATLKRIEGVSEVSDEITRFDEDEFMSQGPEDAYESLACAE